MILSMQNEYFNRLTLEQSLQKVGEFGLKHVECSVLWFRNMEISRVRETLARQGIAISAINTWFDKQTVEEKRDYVLEGVEIAKQLGVRYVIVYFGNLAQEPTVELFEKSIRPCLSEAEKCDIVLAMETEFDSSGKDLTRTAEGTLHILKAVNSKYLKLNFDPGNTYIAGEEPYPYAYEMLKEYIEYVHLKDAVKYSPLLHGPEEENLVFKDVLGKYICVPLGKGAINYEDFLESLRRDGYRGFLTIEPHVTHSRLDDTYKNSLNYVRTKLTFPCPSVHSR